MPVLLWHRSSVCKCGSSRHQDQGLCRFRKSAPKNISSDDKLGAKYTPTRRALYDKRYTSSRTIARYLDRLLGMQQM